MLSTARRAIAGEQVYSRSAGRYERFAPGQRNFEVRALGHAQRHRISLSLELPTHRRLLAMRR